MIALRLLWILPIIFLLAGFTYADNEACYDCHSDEDLDMVRGGRTLSVYVDEDVFTKSVHA